MSTAWRAWSLPFSIMICAMPPASGAPRTPDAFTLSINRQPLDSALQQLASQCGIQMIYFSRVTEGFSAPAIAGDYTLPVAMERLLAGSGLTFRVINPQTVEVRPARARTAERSRAVAKAPEPSPKATQPLEEVIVVGLAQDLVATRIPTPLREIPQTVSIVTHEQMRQRNDIDLADVLKHEPGITMSTYNSLDAYFYARGYQINSFHIDGGAAINPKITAQLAFYASPDLIEFDHVEILRGADGLFGGNGNPGGTVSLVRKRPQHNFAAEVSATSGSWDRQRIEADFTGPIALDGALRGRLAAVYEHAGYFYDIDPHEKKKIFGALEYDLSAAATLTAGASYQWDKSSLAQNGLPVYADGRDSHLPRSLMLAFDWSRYRSDLGEIYLQYRQELASEWGMKFNVAGWRAETERTYGSFDASINPATNALNERPTVDTFGRPAIYEQGSADATLTGTLHWFGWREEVAIGADFTRFNNREDWDFYIGGFGPLLLDPRTFDPANYPDPRETHTPEAGQAVRWATDQYGMFASLRVDFDDAWSIVGGARLSGDETDILLITSIPRDQPVFRIPVSQRWGTDHIVTPYAGLTYTFNRHYSLYASYADIYYAQRTEERTPGNRLRPRRGVNIEAGIKAEWRNGAINGSLAGYRIEQSRIAQLIYNDAGPGNCCFGGLSSKSRGVDTELSGQLLPGWVIGAGYSFNENEGPTGDLLSTITPKHLLKAWTNVRLPGVLNRWQVGGSLHAQSKTTNRKPESPVEFTQPAYGVVDLRAGFDVDENWQVALSMNNVLDKVYYQSIDSLDLPAINVWYGEPRHWMMRIDGRY